jgi:hypothetical protein
MRRLGWVALFAIAFGWIEAAVVVYLRRIFHPDGFEFPLRLFDPDLVGIEIAREAATLLALLSVASLAGRGGWARFGAFAFAFGVWDLAFYGGLKIALGWPESLATWDVLFLIPGIWTGPVWSAAGVALLLVIHGALLYRAALSGTLPGLRLGDWLGGGLSILLLLAAFLWNHGPASRSEVPDWFPWPIWLAGVTAGVWTFARFTRREADGSRETG